MYLDAATDRIARLAERSFDDAVEASRLGTIFGAPGKPAQRLYRAWRTRKRTTAGAEARPQGLAGAPLERAVMAIAMTTDVVAPIGQPRRKPQRPAADRGS